MQVKIHDLKETIAATMSKYYTRNAFCLINQTSKKTYTCSREKAYFEPLRSKNWGTCRTAKR